jgi:ferrous iron transport protein A
MNLVGNLSQLPLGQLAVISEMCGELSVNQKLMTMGMIPGTEIRKVQVAPLGDPIAVEFKGQKISLRKTEAAGVFVDLKD